MVFSALREQKFLPKVNLICESKIPKGETLLKGNSIDDAVKAHTSLESNEIVNKYKGTPSNLDYYFS